MGPIVPMNRNYFGSPYSPSSISPYSAGGYFDAPQNQQSNFPISPLNSRMWNSRPMDVESFGSSDFAAYRQNAALLQHQQPHGMDPLISSINPLSNRMMPDSMMPINAQRRASMPPIQVIYGKPGPMEIQPEEPTVGSTQQSASSSSQSSLPLFLQGAPEDAVEEHQAEEHDETNGEEVSQVPMVKSRESSKSQGSCVGPVVVTDENLLRTDGGGRAKHNKLLQRSQPVPIAFNLEAQILTTILSGDFYEHVISDARQSQSLFQCSIPRLGELWLKWTTTFFIVVFRWSTRWSDRLPLSAPSIQLNSKGHLNRLQWCLSQKIPTDELDQLRSSIRIPDADAMALGGQIVLEISAPFYLPIQELALVEVAISLYDFAILIRAVSLSLQHLCLEKLRILDSTSSNDFLLELQRVRALYSLRIDLPLSENWARRPEHCKSESIMTVGNVEIARLIQKESDDREDTTTRFKLQLFDFDMKLLVTVVVFSVIFVAIDALNDEGASIAVEQEPMEIMEKRVPHPSWRSNVRVSQFQQGAMPPLARYLPLPTGRQIYFGRYARVPFSFNIPSF
ncbi:hypothetical protein M3Y96_01063100 [Aphelenchoides besseyi]|nr:hypothetical protein M3Y96_01063100 [Aphelenchoides besseyi]